MTVTVLSNCFGHRAWWLLRPNSVQFVFKIFHCFTSRINVLSFVFMTFFCLMAPIAFCIRKYTMKVRTYTRAYRMNGILITACEICTPMTGKCNICSFRGPQL